MAEIMLHMLETYKAPPELDAIEEAIGLVDVVLQAYLAAARQSDPVYSQAALSRLARGAELGAEKLENMTLPQDLSAEEKELVKDAMAKRAEQLRSDSKEALAECARRAKASYLLDGAGRACIAGAPPKEDPVRFSALSPRKKTAKLTGIDEARDRLSKNPDDLVALESVGKAFYDAGDYHAARLVLARTIEAGGGAQDLNLLGMASYHAGDILGALEAFGRAKDAGSKAAVLNLAAICKELGINSLAEELLKEAPSKVEEDLLINARSLMSANTGGGK
jgi:tetratricopeptide (TPR) repeat protein